MNEQEREVLEGHVRTLKDWLHRGGMDKPTVGLLSAMQAAVNAMQEEQERTRLSYARPCAVLLYHIKEPTAWLFRDPVTIATIKTGLLMLERKRDRRP